MTEPVGTAKPSLDVVLVSVCFAVLMLLGTAVWSIWRGLFPYWGSDVFFVVAVAACMLCLLGGINSLECEDPRPDVEVELSELRGEVEGLRREVQALRSERSEGR